MRRRETSVGMLSLMVLALDSLLMTAPDMSNALIQRVKIGECCLSKLTGELVVGEVREDHPTLHLWQS